MKFLIRLRVLFGAKICPRCGSSNIVVRGYEGVNERYDCKDCGIETSIYGVL